MRKTKIVCTIGPACDGEDMLRKIMLAGMNVARLNFSHGTHEEHQHRIDQLKKVREELGLPVAILLDTKGPEVRTRRLEGEQVKLDEGKSIVLTVEDVPGTEERVSVTFAHLPNYLQKGNTILLDDGLIELVVQSVTTTEVHCTIITGGVLGNNKSINVPGVSIDMPFLSDKDRGDILFGIENDVDYVALSFVRSAQDVREARRYIQAQGNYSIELIAKIENTEGVKNINEIIRASEGVMVARGDMGVEIPFEELPNVQKSIISACCQLGKKVITATQMLDSMIHNPRPTRAEITDVANAIYDGTTAIMLSGETAIGSYPLRSVETMSRIAEETERHIDYESLQTSISAAMSVEVSTANAISNATCKVAQGLSASAILAVTLSGSSANAISKFRPATPIIAVTPSEKAYTKLALAWGVTPIRSEYKTSTDELSADAVSLVEEREYVRIGDVVVITGSTHNSRGSTNMIQVHIVGNILIKGVGNGTESVTGRVFVVKESLKEFSDLSDFRQGDILVISRTTTDILHIMKQCSAVITEERQEDSSAIPAGYALDIPVISNATGATSMLRTGSILRVDAKSGHVYISDG